METAVRRVEDVRIRTCYHRLVIGCHFGLEKFEIFDIDNGKTLVAKYCLGVLKDKVDVETTMPSEGDLKTNLISPQSHMFLVFVGHSDNRGNMKLKNDDKEQELLAPLAFLNGLMGCKGTLTVCLYTCYSHIWKDAIQKLKNGSCRDFFSQITINLRVSTQPFCDVANAKIISHQLKDYYPQIVGEQSEGKDGKGHSCLHDDIQDGALLSYA